MGGQSKYDVQFLGVAFANVLFHVVFKAKKSGAITCDGEGVRVGLSIDNLIVVSRVDDDPGIWVPGSEGSVGNLQVEGDGQGSSLSDGTVTSDEDFVAGSLPAEEVACFKCCAR